MALGAMVRAGIFISVVVAVTPPPTPGTPCSDHTRILFAGPRLASGTAAINSGQTAPEQVDDSATLGWMVSRPWGAVKNFVCGLVIAGFSSSLLLTTRNSV